MTLNIGLVPATAQTTGSYPKLGIIAGSGDLPGRLIAACQKMGREVFVLSFPEANDKDAIASVPNEQVHLGAIGHAISLLKIHGVQELVMAGRIERPSLSSIRPDMGAAKLLARIGGSLFSGDDKLLTIVIGFLEDEGFKVVGVDEILSELLAPEGLIGIVYPDKRAQADIELGAKVARTIGMMDIGQAVLVQQGTVLGIEAVEGTDRLIERCAPFRIEGGGGVLVKVKKPRQERRADLPTIGVATIENLHKAGFTGVAVEAGGSLIMDRKAVARAADAYGIFVVGFTVND